ncbi:hypothetical protein BDN72DRAFT_839619 [Pluteus cervinus]|uniref:Uncharacterized protein n=1 Tax=Pluteus cervinus TaxID=181527 RepID=A0ACD3AWK1_9AGAR|nr:hypothetical protein BDN72DRAFT_839619 [Pluteus cervinus]
MNSISSALASSQPTASMMSTIPQEVVDHIIDYFHDDRKTLVSTSYVCPSWHASSRAHLFYRIDLTVPDPLYGDYDDGHFVTPPSPLKKYQRLYGLLVHDRGIANAVKELTISNAHQLGPSAWASVEPTLALILCKLHCVRVIRLSEVYFNHLKPDFQNALSQVCSSSTVSLLDISNCNSLTWSTFDDITGAPNGLRSLRMAFVRAQNASLGFVKEEPPLFLVKPQSLTIESSLDPVITWLMHPYSTVSLSDLRELRLTHLENIPNLNDLVYGLLDVAGGSLEYLELWAPSGKCSTGGPPPGPMGKLADINLTPNLQELRIAGLHFSRQVCLVAAATVFLIGATAPLNLRKFSILANVESDSPKGHDLDWAAWKGLDEVLSGPLFKPFEKLEVTMLIQGQGIPEHYRANLVEQFPRLHERKILSVIIEH